MINQFPDRRADEGAAKRHWVVRLRPRTVARGYAGIAVAAYAWLVAAVISKQLPAAAIALSRPGGPRRAMDFTKQKQRSAPVHQSAMKEGQTCIDCHKRIAHQLPQ